MLKLKNNIVKILLELFVFDKHKRSILKAKWAKYNLQKYVDYATNNLKNTNDEENPKIIWQYWHQGEDKAPTIVKKCLETIKKYYPDYQINVLSYETIKDYIQLPERFYWLLKNDKISVAHFSDILRLNLLSQYGGMWIDATIYATGKLDDKILNSNFFMFQKNPKIDPSQNNNSCYFVKANKGNIFLEAIKLAFEKYLSENDFIMNYFTFEHLVTMLSNSTEELTEIWNKMPCIYTNDICAIQDKKFNKIDKSDFDKILNSTTIHKLTYKTIPEGYSEKDTYLSKLLEIN